MTDAVFSSRHAMLDVLRGMALLMVLVDHIEANARCHALSSWTLKEFGLSDGAEVFVFLSGYVFGIAYHPRIRMSGLGKAQAKAAKRSIQIYFTYLVTIAISVNLGYSFEGLSYSLHRRLALYRGAEDCLLWALCMGYQPYGTGILCLYITILPIMPFLLWLFMSRPAISMAISLTAYLLSQIQPGFVLPCFPGGSWSFNPLGWQFLFFLGFACHVCKPGIVYKKKLFLAAALFFLVLSFVLKSNWQKIESLPQISSLLFFAEPMSDKKSLGPLRVIHFVLLVFVFSQVAPKANSSLWRSPLLDPLAVCGQASLELYAFGIILLFASIAVFDAFTNMLPVVFLTTALSIALSVCLAYCIRVKRRVATARLIPTEPVSRKTNATQS